MSPADTSSSGFGISRLILNVLLAVSTIGFTMLTVWPRIPHSHATLKRDGHLDVGSQGIDLGHPDDGG